MIRFVSPLAIRRVLPILGTILWVLMLGCRNNSAPVVEDERPVTATATAPTGDARVLLILDPYDPMYKLDSKGRVTNLRLPNRHLPTPIMAEIGKLTELQKLDLYGASITDDGLAQLKDLQKLKSMGLGGTPITDEGLVHMQKLKGLRHTWLPKNDQITEAGIENLKDACPQLTVH